MNSSFPKKEKIGFLGKTCGEQEQSAVQDIYMPLKQALPAISSVFLCVLAGSCTHLGYYPVNEPLNKYEPGYEYIIRNNASPDNSQELFLILFFSGGGTRAAPFSYSVLEELRTKEVTPVGRKRSLLSEVDLISGVSGGSFTAAYYGLFGDRSSKISSAVS